MTKERNAIDLLSGCTFLPGSFDKRFVRTLSGYPEDHILTPKQRVVLWKLVVKYRRQLKEHLLKWAEWWLGRHPDQIAYEQQLDADPRNFALRGVYADWLMEHAKTQDDEFARLAYAQRWMQGSQKAPSLNFATNWSSGNLDWNWHFEFDSYPYWFSDSREELEQRLADALSVHRSKAQQEVAS